MKVGTIVYLKVGSPPMIVNGLTRDDNIVMVEWFDGRELRRESFDPECIFEETPELKYYREATNGNGMAGWGSKGPEKIPSYEQRLKDRLDKLEKLLEPV